MPAVAPVKDGVLEQVGHGATESGAIGPDSGEVSVDPSEDPQAPLAGRRLDGRGRLPEEGLDRDRLEAPPALAGVGAGEGEHALDHLREAAALVPDDASVLTGGATVGDEARGQVVPGDADGGEGSAQLVGDAGHELELPVG